MICPDCGWSLDDLGPPMGTDTIPDLGGYCVDCALDKGIIPEPEPRPLPAHLRNL